MNKQVTAFLLSGMLAATAVLFSGCARREHIRDDHGEPSQAWWQAQALATEREQAEGLDSEEAALIHQNYRASLGRDGARAGQESQVLTIQEPSRNDRSR